MSRFRFLLERSYRYVFFLWLPVLVVVLNSFGPDGWRGPAVWLVNLSWSAICVALAHSARTALLPYVSMGRDLYESARLHPIGAGLYALGVCILTGLIFLGLLLFAGGARAQPVPERAVTVAPLVVTEIDNHFPGIPRRSYVGALVEKESCPGLSHPYCWNPAARLKTSREEGGGLGQLTRAWTPAGALRFDALAEVRQMDPKALRELTWENVYQRADLGVRAILVKMRDCHNRMRQRAPEMADMARLAFCDAAYSGGYGAMLSERNLCFLTAGCDANQWFGHTEKHSNKSRVAMTGYGAQSPFSINRAHVKATVLYEPRRWRYIEHLGV